MKRTFLLLMIAILTSFVLAACGGGGTGADYSAEDIAAGEEIFASTCAACHGVDAKGLPNLGKDMTASEFIAEQSDADLLAFVKTGRPIGDPLNTTGVDMPPKGGNPALGDDDINLVIAFMRSVQE